MPKFSKQSATRLATCHPDIQTVMNEAIKEFDFAVICGARGEAEQNQAYALGTSKLKYPNSKHNAKPSLAVDIAPHPIDWNNLKLFHDLSKVIKRIAKEKGIAITWGGDWRKFKDYPHYELTT